ncbi:3135_t:CDS:1, partial [Funneliformis geosporum]
IDTLFGMRENHNPQFLVDGFSNNVKLFNSFEEKQEPKENPIKIKNDQVNKKRKLTYQDSLTEAMISMSNMQQAVWEK